MLSNSISIRMAGRKAGGGSGYTTLMSDKFPDDTPAPMPDQSPAYPGPGVRTVTASSRWSTNGVFLHLLEGAAADASIEYGSLAHSPGRAFLFSIAPVGNSVTPGWGDGYYGGSMWGWNKNGPTFDYRSVIGPPGFAQYDRYAIIRLASGYFAWLHRDMSAPGKPWKHYFTTRTTSTAALTGAVATGPVPSAEGSLDYVGIVDFTNKRLVSREGMATFYDNSPSSQSFSHYADMLLDIILSTLPSTTLQLKFRKQDESNYLYVSVSSGGTVTIGEVIAGVNTAYDSSKTITTGKRLIMYADGDTVGVAVDDGSNHVSFWSGAADSTLSTYTSGELVAGGATLADLYVYPRQPLGMATIDRAFHEATDPEEDIPSGEYGLTVTGGAGGTVIYVETEEELVDALAGNGSGLTPSTPRIVKFGASAPDFIDLTEAMELYAVSNLTWDGSGSTTVVRGADKTFYNGHNILLKDLTLAGADPAPTYTTIHAVQFIGCHDVSVQFCTLVFGNDESMSFTRCDDVYIYRCLIGDALDTVQAYGLFFGGGSCNRVIVLECALSNCTVRMPYTQGGAGHHYVRLYIHGSYIGPYILAEYGNIQVNMIDLVYGKDLDELGQNDWVKIWSHPLVPYVATAYWNSSVTPYRLYPAEYTGNTSGLSPDPIQDEANIPTPTGDIEDLLDLLISNAGRRVDTATPTFDAITENFKTRMQADPDILSTPYWPT